MGKCSQGNDVHPDSGATTFCHIRCDRVPKHKKPTCTRIVAEDRHHKAISKCICLTARGNQIECAGAVSTKTSDLTTANACSTVCSPPPDAEFMAGTSKIFASTHQWTSASTCKFVLMTANMTSCTDAICTPKFATDVHAQMLEKECTASHKQATLPMIDWSNF